jgi:hypothetical protein
MKVEFSQQVFKKYSNIKFHEYPQSGCRVVPCGQIDRTQPTVAFCYIVDTLKNLTHAYFGSDIVPIPEQLKHTASLVKNTLEEQESTNFPKF